MSAPGDTRDGARDGARDDARDGARDGTVDFRSVFEQLPSAYLLLDGEGVVVAVNRACAERLGRGPEELVGRRPAEAVPALLTADGRLPGTSAPVRDGAGRTRFTLHRLDGPATTLAELSLRLTGAGSLEEIEHLVVEEGLAVLGVDGGGLASPVEGGGWRLTGSTGLDEGIRAEHALVPADSPLPVCHSARTGERVVLPDPAAAEAFAPVMREVVERTGRRAWTSLPLLHEGRPIGALAVAWREEHRSDEAELAVVEACAAHCARALARVLQRREHLSAAERMGQVLQRSLLTRPPVHEGLRVAVRSRPAARGAEVGGDWFDAFPTGSGGTVLVVGDVCGHDQAAAAAMGQVRSLVRGLAYDGDDRPVNLLARLDRAVAGLGLDVMATAVLATVDAPAGAGTGWRLRWANAGHLPPLLRRADGRVQVLGLDGDLLLGVDPGAVRHEHVTDVFPGDVLVLYTDGLVERRDRDLDDGIGLLAAVLSGPDGLDATAWADALVAGLEEDALDDAALLVLHVDPDGALTPAVIDVRDEIDVTLPADPRSAREARRLAQRCCHRAGLPEGLVDTTVLLTSEVVTNAVVHGRSETRLRVRAGAGDVHVEVEDDNDRLPVLQVHDDDALSGRGIGMLQEESSAWGVRSTALGKVVWFTVSDR
ncbi:ATP-binding SpoIIE family protein phosphatase [Kineococcus indalonis]|uniref:ATP-binding SpoIIE family protein phosphatase n=1 Tax=Kineococcus indalonis TaxID=2696566 RepID=UPI001412B438|nr:SpoIIE family protein phosphatase [Kineococcus indalonis]NAZ85842.1 SpoIIE family protein phosphatase [Kineococcus indalonis]